MQSDNFVQRVMEYRNDPGISSSLLRATTGGLGSILKYLNKEEEDEIVKKEKPHLLIGSIADLYLSYEDAVQDLFHVPEVDIPKRSVVTAVHELLKLNGVESLNDDEKIDHLVEIANRLELEKGIKNEEKRRARFSEGLAYLNERIENANKAFVKSEDFSKARIIADNFLSGQYTSHFFIGNEIKLYQVPLYLEHNGIRYKALVDMLIIDVANKTIRVIDFKTTSFSTFSFPNAMYRFRYDIQGDFYTWVVEKLIEKGELDLDLDVNLLDFNVLNPIFIVESTTYSGTPLPFEFTDSTRNMARYGGVRNDRYIKGWVESRDLYLRHSLEDQWKLPFDQLAELKDNFKIYV